MIPVVLTIQCDDLRLLREGSEADFLAAARAEFEAGLKDFLEACYAELEEEK